VREPTSLLSPDLPKQFLFLQKSTAIYSDVVPLCTEEKCTVGVEKMRMEI